MLHSDADAHLNVTAEPKILIVGAGIGGLCAAIALRQSGFEVDVFERAPELKEIGAGIALSATAMRVLKHLGLMPQVVEKSTVLDTIITYNFTGKLIGRLPVNGIDVPTVCLHRADLQQVLLSALGAESIHLGEEFVGFEQTGGGVIARFSSGHTAQGDALIGADGLHSRVRAQLLGAGAPIYRGYQCWRGVCSVPASKELTETFGRGVRMGIVPIGRRGTAWWCCANEAERANDGGEGAKSKLLRLIGNWHQPIPELIAATDPAAIIKTGIYDRRPSKRWSSERCTLLGDAAHPTTPNMGQGGVMAIEDAIVLTRCLSASSVPARAFSVYERLRYARTARIVNISRWYGVIGQWENRGAVWLRTAMLRLASGAGATRSYGRFVSYDPSRMSLNEA